MNLLRWLVGMSLCLGVTPHALAVPKISVTDLTYKEHLSGYFRYVDYHHQAAQSAQYQMQSNAAAASAQGGQKADQATDYTEVEHHYQYLNYGELRKFVGDIKGEILRGGEFRLTQAKPYTAQDSENIYDIIARIKKGFYPGADYVLFGTLSELDFRQQQQPVYGTDSMSIVFNLMLTAEFSLIDTRTYEVKAAFSAIGEGQDMRILTPGAKVIPGRAKVVAQVSKSLGEDVAQQIDQQLTGFQSVAPKLPVASPDSSWQEGEVRRY
ncbi:MAG: penicillin-binding protein activator LpoB [Methylococcales bacterium]|nr:penicillin-binding protein activator LpoB [Methylococcales bacterium]